MESKLLMKIVRDDKKNVNKGYFELGMNTLKALNIRYELISPCFGQRTLYKGGHPLSVQEPIPSYFIDPTQLNKVYYL